MADPDRVANHFADSYRHAHGDRDAHRAPDLPAGLGGIHQAGVPARPADEQSHWGAHGEQHSDRDGDPFEHPDQQSTRSSPTDPDTASQQFTDHVVQQADAVRNADGQQHTVRGPPPQALTAAHSDGYCH